MNKASFSTWFSSFPIHKLSEEIQKLSDEDLKNCAEFCNGKSHECFKMYQFMCFVKLKDVDNINKIFAFEEGSDHISNLLPHYFRLLDADRLKVLFLSDKLCPRYQKELEKFMRTKRNMLTLSFVDEVFERYGRMSAIRMIPFLKEEEKEEEREKTAPLLLDYVVKKLKFKQFSFAPLKGHFIKHKPYLVLLWMKYELSLCIEEKEKIVLICDTYEAWLSSSFIKTPAKICREILSILSEMNFIPRFIMNQQVPLIRKCPKEFMKYLETVVRRAGKLEIVNIYRYNSEPQFEPFTFDGGNLLQKGKLTIQDYLSLFETIFKYSGQTYNPTISSMFSSCSSLVFENLELYHSFWNQFFLLSKKDKNEYWAKLDFIQNIGNDRKALSMLPFEQLTISMKEKLNKLKKETNNQLNKRERLIYLEGMNILETRKELQEEMFSDPEIIIRMEVVGTIIQATRLFCASQQQEDDTKRNEILKTFSFLEEKMRNDDFKFRSYVIRELSSKKTLKQFLMDYGSDEILSVFQKLLDHVCLGKDRGCLYDVSRCIQSFISLFDSVSDEKEFQNRKGHLIFPNLILPTMRKLFSTKEQASFFLNSRGRGRGRGLHRMRRFGRFRRRRVTTTLGGGGFHYSSNASYSFSPLKKLRYGGKHMSFFLFRKIYEEFLMNPKMGIFEKEVIVNHRIDLFVYFFSQCPHLLKEHQIIHSFFEKILFGDDPNDIKYSELYHQFGREEIQYLVTQYLGLFKKNSTKRFEIMNKLFQLDPSLICIFQQHHEKFDDFLNPLLLHSSSSSSKHQQQIEKFIKLLLKQEQTISFDLFVNLFESNTKNDEKMIPKRRKRKMKFIVEGEEENSFFCFNSLVLSKIISSLNTSLELCLQATKMALSFIQQKEQKELETNETIETIVDYLEVCSLSLYKFEFFKEQQQIAEQKEQEIERIVQQIHDLLNRFSQHEDQRMKWDVLMIKTERQQQQKNENITSKICSFLEIMSNENVMLVLKKLGKLLTFSTKNLLLCDILSPYLLFSSNEQKKKKSGFGVTIQKKLLEFLSLFVSITSLHMSKTKKKEQKERIVNEIFYPLYFNDSKKTHKDLRLCIIKRLFDFLDSSSSSTSKVFTILEFVAMKETYENCVEVLFTLKWNRLFHLYPEEVFLDQMIQLQCLVLENRQNQGLLIQKCLSTMNIPLLRKFCANHPSSSTEKRLLTTMIHGICLKFEFPSDHEMPAAAFFTLTKLFLSKKHEDQFIELAQKLCDTKNRSFEKEGISWDNVLVSRILRFSQQFHLLDELYVEQFEVMRKMMSLWMDSFPFLVYSLLWNMLKKIKFINDEVILCWVNGLDAEITKRGCLDSMALSFKSKICQDIKNMGNWRNTRENYDVVEVVMKRLLSEKNENKGKMSEFKKFMIVVFVECIGEYRKWNPESRELLNSLRKEWDQEKPTWMTLFAKSFCIPYRFFN